MDDPWSSIIGGKYVCRSLWPGQVGVQVTEGEGEEGSGEQDEQEVPQVREGEGYQHRLHIDWLFLYLSV